MSKTYPAPSLKQYIKEGMLRLCIHSRLEYGLPLMLVRSLAKNYNHPVTSTPPVEACSVLCPCFSPHFSHPFVYNWLHSSRQRFLFSPFPLYFSSAYCRNDNHQWTSLLRFDSTPAKWRGWGLSCCFPLVEGMEVDCGPYKLCCIWPLDCYNGF